MAAGKLWHIREPIIRRIMNMDKYIYDENNGLWYELQSDYYIPCLTISEEEQRTIGIWGRRHLQYIREYRQGLYNSLLLSGKLNSYLADMNE